MSMFNLPSLITSQQYIFMDNEGDNYFLGSIIRKNLFYLRNECECISLRQEQKSNMQ